MVDERGAEKESTGVSESESTSAAISEGEVLNS